MSDIDDLKRLAGIGQPGSTGECNHSNNMQINIQEGAVSYMGVKVADFGIEEQCGHQVIGVHPTQAMAQFRNQVSNLPQLVQGMIDSNIEAIKEHHDDGSRSNLFG